MGSYRKVMINICKVFIFCLIANGVSASRRLDTLRVNLFLGIQQDDDFKKILPRKDYSIGIPYDQYKASSSDDFGADNLEMEDPCSGVICSADKISVSLECCDFKKYRKNI